MEELFRLNGVEFRILLWENECLDEAVSENQLCLEANLPKIELMEAEEGASRRIFSVNREIKVLIEVLEEQPEDSINPSGIRRNYSGGILAGKDFLNEYGEGFYACISYKHVTEFIFENGRLVAAVDHTRGIHRIRKNIDTGLRDLSIKRDERVIRRFLKKMLLGKYGKRVKKGWFSKKEKLTVKE